MKLYLFLSQLFFSLPLALLALPEKPDGAFRIALLGCIRQDLDAPALEKYPHLEQDLNLWLGDNIYADTEDDPSFIRACYEQLAAKPGFDGLMAAAPSLVTWDDHDYGDNDETRHYPLKAESLAIFRDFWNYESRIPEDQPGIWHQETFALGDHTLQVIMLDVRYHRDYPETGGDILGEQQWAWFEEALEVDADLRIIASGSQILLGRDSGSETWARYPKSRQRLFQTIRERGLERVFFLTGDQHYGEVLRMPRAVDYDAVEFQFAGVNQGESPEPSDLRVANAATARNSYAVLDIVHDPEPWNPPYLRYHIYDADEDRAELMYRVNLHELELDFDFRGPFKFWEQGIVGMAKLYPELDLRYTTDGSEPDARSPLYTEPFAVEETVDIAAALFLPDGTRRGPVQRQRYERLAMRPAVEVEPDALSEGLRYEYHEGYFKRLPDFSKMSPLTSGVVEGLDPERVKEREEAFAVVYSGLLSIGESGAYRVLLRSDDGSRIFLHDRLIVDNDGSHSPRTREGFVALEAGLHPLRIDYFEDHAGEFLALQLENLETGEVTPFSLLHRLEADR